MNLNSNENDIKGNFELIKDKFRKTHLLEID